MARPLRLEYPGAVYHVTTRGNARQPIFTDDEDREIFLALLGAVVKRYNWLCHAYCLMGNHYHLLLETLDANLSLGMRQLNGMYTQRFNRRHDRTGHVFQGRFKAVLVEKEAYLLELCRYVVLNPVRAGVAESPADWPWSSYRATAGVEPAPEFLQVDWVRGLLGARRATALRHYQSFVQEGMQAASPWPALKGQLFLGGEGFIGEMQERLIEKRALPEIPRRQRYAGRPPLAALFAGNPAKPERNRIMLAAHLEHGYSLKEIAGHLDIHYTTVSKAISRAMAEKDDNSRPDP